MRIEAARSGLLPTSRPPRGRGGYRGRARGFNAASRGSDNARGSFRGRGRGRGFAMNPRNTNLDRRPSRILVTGYDIEEKEEVINHFNKFGEVVDTVDDEVVTHAEKEPIEIYNIYRQHHLLFSNTRLGDLLRPLWRQVKKKGNAYPVNIAYVVPKRIL